RPHEMREGDTFSDGNSTYRVERIQLDPPEVVVARTASGRSQPEMKILRPPAKAGGLAGTNAPARPYADRPARTLATNEK
ncbi:MAG: hypothetical protein HYV75_11890, partial [Opitutae bacterium]|nr:hypothetical protein [Opitutae bacterium]